MKTQRNRWRVVRSREAVPGMWIVGEKLPADAFAPATWWSSAIFRSYEAAIVYATRMASGDLPEVVYADAVMTDARTMLSRSVQAREEAVAAYWAEMERRRPTPLRSSGPLYLMDEYDRLEAETRRALGDGGESA